MNQDFQTIQTEGVQIHLTPQQYLTCLCSCLYRQGLNAILIHQKTLDLSPDTTIFLASNSDTHMIWVHICAQLNMAKEMKFSGQCIHLHFHQWGNNGLVKDHIQHKADLYQWQAKQPHPMVKMLNSGIERNM